MREIKFRVYIKKKHENHNFDAGMYEWEDIKNWAYLWEMVEERLVELMQFIGFNDKNGIEIYIGDKYKWYQPLVENGKQVRKERISDVKDDIVELYYLHNRAENCWDGVEVIGNIHQNPELLESS